VRPERQHAGAAPSLVASVWAGEVLEVSARESSKLAGNCVNAKRRTGGRTRPRWAHVCDLGPWPTVFLGPSGNSRGSSHKSRYHPDPDTSAREVPRYPSAAQSSSEPAVTFSAFASFNDRNRRIARAAFKIADVGPMDAGSVSEFFLAQAMLMAAATQVRGKSLADIHPRK